MGETDPRARGVLDFAAIYDSIANPTEDLTRYVPRDFLSEHPTDPVTAITRAPMFNNENLPQYNAWGTQPQFQNAKASADLGAVASTDPTVYAAQTPNRQRDLDNAAIAAYGVFSPPGPLRDLTEGATSYATTYRPDHMR